MGVTLTTLLHSRNDRPCFQGKLRLRAVESFAPESHPKAADTGEFHPGECVLLRGRHNGSESCRAAHEACAGGLEIFMSDWV